MAQRGRKSANALAAIQPATETRLRAPEGLSAAEFDLWLDTVQLVPASFFPPEASEQLAAYVRHAVSARDLSKLVAEFNPKWIGAPGGLERLDKLLKARERETRAMLSAARALRLTNQSRQDPKSAHRQRADGWGRSYYDTMDDFDDD